MSKLLLESLKYYALFNFPSKEDVKLVFICSIRHRHAFLPAEVHVPCKDLCRLPLLTISVETYSITASAPIWLGPSSEAYAALIHFGIYGSPHIFDLPAASDVD